MSSRSSSRKSSSRKSSSRSSSNKSYIPLPPLHSSSNMSNVRIYTPDSFNIGFPNARSSNSNISGRALKGRTPRSISAGKKYILKKRLKTYKKKYNRNNQIAALAALRKAENALRRSIAKSRSTRKQLSVTAPSWSPKYVSRPTLVTSVNADKDMSSYNRDS